VTLPEAIRDVLARASHQNRPVVEGRVTGLLGIAVEVVGLRAAIGDLCTIHTPSGVSTPAEVVGFQGERTMVMPLGEPNGIGPGARVTHHARPLCVTTGDALLGRVLDALGRPVDGGPPLVGPDRPVTNDPPAALARSPIVEPIETGFSAIDGLLTCGKGQRVGIFAGSGVGKSTLLGGIARGSSAQVNVIALIGERGREVGDFLREVLGEEGMRKSVVVVATSDAPAMLRFKGAYTAVTIAANAASTCC
jgi:flagellum-specific ATP synthase